VAGALSKAEAPTVPKTLGTFIEDFAPPIREPVATARAG
jgi:hypothetical protein